MKMRYNAARAVLELMPVTPDCPQATIALLTSKADTHRSTSDIKVLRRCGNRAVKLAENGLKQPTSATSKVVSAETIKALDAHRAAEAVAGEKRAWMRAEDVALLELHAGDLPMSAGLYLRTAHQTRHECLVCVVLGDSKTGRHSKTSQTHTMFVRQMEATLPSFFCT
jgi:hypothetical protein